MAIPHDLPVKKHKDFTRQAECPALYQFPHVFIASMIGRKLSPTSVSEYSTWS